MRIRHLFSRKAPSAALPAVLQVVALPLSVCLTACGGGGDAPADPAMQSAASAASAAAAGGPTQRALSSWWTDSTYAIVVRAAGQKLGGVGPTMQLRINDTMMGNVTLTNTDFQDIRYVVPGPIAAGTKIDVVFLNDAASATEDRNLFVQQIVVDGVTYAADASGVTYDRGDGRAAFDGKDVIPGTQAMAWNGALRFVAGKSGTPSKPLTLMDKVAAPGTLKNLANSGPLVISKNNQVIQGLRITSNSGACITLLPGVTDITIRDNEIGPCQNDGIHLEGNARVNVLHNYIHDTTQVKHVQVPPPPPENPNNDPVLKAQEDSYLAIAASNNSTLVDGNGVEAIDSQQVVVQYNYIRNVTSGLFAQGGSGFTFDSNMVLDVHFDPTRALVPRIGGQMVQLNQLATGSGSRITCNMSDQNPATSQSGDHVNVHKTYATAASPLLIAYNRFRGWSIGGGAGTGTLVGDGGGSYARVLNNVYVDAAGVGPSVGAGFGHSIEGNLVLFKVLPIDHLRTRLWPTGVKIHSWEGNACYGNKVSGNRVHAVRSDLSWSYGGQEYESDPSCESTSFSGNVFGDAAALPEPDVLFATEPPECR